MEDVALVLVSLHKFTLLTEFFPTAPFRQHCCCHHVS